MTGPERRTGRRGLGEKCGETSIRRAKGLRSWGSRAVTGHCGGVCLGCAKVLGGWCVMWWVLAAPGHMAWSAARPSPGRYSANSDGTTPPLCSGLWTLGSGSRLHILPHLQSICGIGCGKIKMHRARLLHRITALETRHDAAVSRLSASLLAPAPEHGCGYSVPQSMAFALPPTSHELPQAKIAVFMSADLAQQFWCR